MGGYTQYWAGRSDGYHAQRVAVAVSNKLTPMIIEVTPVNERMRRRIHHSVSVICLVSVYAPTEASDLTLKDALCATLESVVDQCTLLQCCYQASVDQCIRRDTLLYFNASTGTE